MKALSTLQLIGILAVLVLAFVAVGAMRNGWTMFSISGSVISLQQVQYTSSVTELQGANWLAVMLVNGGGDRIYGGVTKESIVDTQNGAKAKSGFTIGLDILKNNYMFPIQNQNAYLVGIKEVLAPTCTWIFCGSQDDFRTLCSSKSGVLWSAGYLFADWRCFVPQNEELKGKVLLTWSGDYALKVTVANNTGTSTSATITNRATLSAFLKDTNGNTFGLVRWSSTLATADIDPSFIDTTDMCAITYPTNNNWAQFASCHKLNDAQAVFNNLVNCMNENSGAADQKAAICKARVDLAVQNAKQAVAFSANTNAGIIEQAEFNGTLSNGMAVFSLDRFFVAQPLLTFILKAEYLGVELLTGTPQIASVGAANFAGCTSGHAQITVKNVGTAAGQFSVSANCGSPITVTTPNVKTSILVVGASQTVTLTGWSNGAGTASCTARAEVPNDPNKYDTRSFTWTSTACANCTNGEEKVIDGRILYRCIDSQWQKILECGAKEIYDPITKACKCVTDCDGCDNDGICESGETYQNCSHDCEPPDHTNWFVIIIAALVGAVGGLFVYLRFKKDKAFGAMIGGVVGAIVALLVYFVIDWLSNPLNLLLVALGGGLLVWFFGAAILGGIALLVAVLRKK